MAAPTNLTTTLNSIGNREDLSDIITRVAPEETPLYSALGRTKATARYHEWQTETLRSPSASNARVEGDDTGNLKAPNLTSRVGNFCQIAQESGGVSRTQEVVDKAGRKSEMNRQKVLKGLELKRDVEASLCSASASRAESGSDARLSAGVLSWLTSNVSRGAGGSSGGFSAGIVAAPTPGTLRDFNESQVKAVRATAFNNGGKAKVAYMGMSLKQKFSGFTGIADIRADVKGANQATIIAGAEVYVDDVGALSLIPHPYAFTRDCLLVDPDKAAVAMLDGFATKPLAVIGDMERFEMTVEYTFECKNERAHAVIADIQ
jgi:hypothetical protein